VTDPAPMIEALSALHEQVLAAGRAFVAEEPLVAAALLHDVAIEARDLAATLRRANEEKP
jgi:predicted HD phosphohydrolase